MFFWTFLNLFLYFFGAFVNKLWSHVLASKENKLIYFKLESGDIESEPLNEPSLTRFHY